MVLLPGRYEWEWYEESFYHSFRIQSSTQSGKTEFAIVSLSAGANDFGWRTMYLLPTQPIRDQFVSNRWDKQVRAIPWYRDRLSDGAVDNKSLKIFAGMNGPVAIRFAYSKSESQVFEFPADRLIVDEYEQCDKANVKNAHGRLDGSDVRLSQMLSNPKFKNAGIEREMAQTDRRRWHERCAHDCHRPDGSTHWYTPDFFLHIVDPETHRARDPHFDGTNELRLICDNCGRPLAQQARMSRSGLWIPTASSSMRGYFVNKLFSARVPFSELYERYQAALTDDEAMQAFENNDLGRGLTLGGVKISEEMLNACIDPEYTLPSGVSDSITCIGIDPGKPIYYEIYKPRGDLMDLVAVGNVHDEASLRGVIEQYNARVGVIDEGPELQMVRNLMASYPHFYRCRYLTGASGRQNVSKEQTQTKNWQERRTLKVNRTVALDNVKSAFVRKIIRLPVNARSLDGGKFYAQMQASTRVYDKDREEYIWTDEGADHHHHAGGYAILARNVALQLAG